MSDSPAIEVRELSKAYRSGLVFRRSFEALKKVTFRVERGEVFGLLGPNGAGKTTLVKVLLGIVRKQGGEAMMLGQPAGRRGGRKLIGYLPENLRIPSHHTALSALRYFGELGNMPYSQIKDRQGPLLEGVGLADRAKDPVKKYSKGMLQRLGLAISLLNDPDLLFLDEPTDGLDPVGRRSVREILTKLKREGKTIFLNSHLLQEVEMVCDRVAILNKGTLCGLGAVDELVAVANPGIEIDFQLTGDPDRISAAMSGHDGTSPVESEDGVLHASARFKDQGEVDRTVDLLRESGISIINLTRHRIGLEEAFLEVLK